MTMKIMISTSRMSINGTTLGDESAPPFSPPTSIPIASLLWAWDRAAPQAHRRLAMGMDVGGEKKSANERYNRKYDLQSADGGRRGNFAFWFFLVSRPS